MTKFLLSFGILYQFHDVHQNKYIAYLEKQVAILKLENT